MISKTKINNRIKKKSNNALVETINLAKKNNLLELAKKLSGPKRLFKSINLDRLNKENSNKVLVVGKVLGSGELEKKIKVVALGFSNSAKIKLKKAGCEFASIKQEILSNPELNNVKTI